MDPPQLGNAMTDPQVTGRRQLTASWEILRSSSDQSVGARTCESEIL